MIFRRFFFIHERIEKILSVFGTESQTEKMTFYMNHQSEGDIKIIYRAELRSHNSFKAIFIVLYVKIPKIFLKQAQILQLIKIGTEKFSVPITFQIFTTF